MASPLSKTCVKPINNHVETEENRFLPQPKEVDDVLVRFWKQFQEQISESCQLLPDAFQARWMLEKRNTMDHRYPVILKGFTKEEKELLINQGRLGVWVTNTRNMTCAGCDPKTSDFWHGFVRPDDAIAMIPSTGQLGGLFQSVWFVVNFNQ